jgi:hypothetical protein
MQVAHTTISEGRGETLMPEEQKITRYTTAEERENIIGIELDASDVDKFVELVRAGLVEAAADHEGAVQDNFALRAENSIRLSRPVRDENGQVVDLVGRELLEGTIRGRKVYKDPAKAPKVDQ